MRRGPGCEEQRVGSGGAGVKRVAGEKTIGGEGGGTVGGAETHDGFWGWGWWIEPKRTKA